jgi:hypothetical protein
VLGVILANMLEVPQWMHHRKLPQPQLLHPFVSFPQTSPISKSTSWPTNCHFLTRFSRYLQDVKQVN